MTGEKDRPGDQTGATISSGPPGNTNDQHTPPRYPSTEHLRALFAERQAKLDQVAAAGYSSRKGDVADDRGAAEEDEDPVVVDDAAPPATLTDARGYGDAAPLYRTGGWLGVLSPPPRSKVPPQHGHSGHEGGWHDGEKRAQWIAERPYDANLCLRLPNDVIGLDVDDWGTKTGGQMLVEVEKRWDALPDAPMSTSRDDGISGTSTQGWRL